MKNTTGNKTIVFTAKALPKRDRTGHRGATSVDWQKVIEPLLRAKAGTEVLVDYGNENSAAARASQLRAQLNSDTFPGVEMLWINARGSQIVFSIEKTKRSKKQTVGEDLVYVSTSVVAEVE